MLNQPTSSPMMNTMLGFLPLVPSFGAAPLAWASNNSLLPLLLPIRIPSGTGSFFGVLAEKCACPPIFRRFSDRLLALSDRGLDGDGRSTVARSLPGAAAAGPLRRTPPLAAT